MPVAHIVANGNIRWCGMIRVNEAYSSDVTNTFEGQTGVETIPGDFNVDGIVDLSDYTVWADHYGQSGYQISGDGNRDGLVDLADYTIWADNYGMTAP
jgi:hypothetical protein